MNSRERISALIARESPDTTGFWLGNPDPATWPILHAYFGTSSEEELRRRLGDDFRWHAPAVHAPAYFHPQGRAMFDLEQVKTRHGEEGPLSHCEDPAEIEDYEWPRLDYLDFTQTIAGLRAFGDVYRAGGMWAPFYHDIQFLLGVENYMVKMYTHPALVHAVTDRVCQFYYDANELFFRQAGDLVDAYFFGNDFGTQRDLMMSPAFLEEFVMPWFRQFTDQGHRWGKQVILHSCGSVYRIIPRLIEAGVDCLHPLQATAAKMAAERRGREFGGRITFLGGIDAQDVLPHGTPEAVRADVARVRRLLGPYVIISPSHEAILPDVPPANVRALADAARGGGL